MTIPFLPPFAVEALRAFLLPVTSARQPDFCVGGTEYPYLRRWHLTPRGEGPAVYLHHFLRSDDGRALHDHPWPSLSLILAGRYFEHVPDSPPLLRVAGMMLERTPEAAHRIELVRDDATGAELPAWTLFLTGPRVREWGFHCPKGWVHWRDFTAGAQGELVGRGCDQ